MKKLPAILVTILATSLLLAAAAAPASEERDERRLLVILTSPETETQAMALALANQVAGGRTPVSVLLCGPAGDLATREPPADASKVVTPTGMTVSTLLAALMARRATVNVCASYLPNRKLPASVLAPGIGVAHPRDIAALMMEEHTRLLTF